MTAISSKKCGVWMDMRLRFPLFNLRDLRGLLLRLSASLHGCLGMFMPCFGAETAPQMNNGQGVLKSDLSLALKEIQSKF